MAPRKKLTLNRTPKSSNEYTPVKASTSCSDGQSPVFCSTSGRAEAEAIEENPSPGIFSPENKLTCDIEWAWKSPIGRMGSSGNTTKRRLMNKTPVPKTKRRAKANSPLNYFPPKRKLRKPENLDTDDLILTQLRALGNNNESTVNPATFLVPTKTTNAANNSLTALLDDDNYFTLLQCSQYIEEKLIDNPDKTAFSPIYINSPVRKISRLNQNSTPKLSSTEASTSFRTPEEEDKLPAKESHAKSSKNHRSLFNIEDKGTVLAKNVPSENAAKAAVDPATSTDLSRVEPVAQIKEPSNVNATTSKNVDDIFADDSYDDVLANFCDENVELLSQGKVAQVEETPCNNVELSSSNQEKVSEYPSSSEAKVASISQDLPRAAVESSAPKAVPCDESYSFDDDFLQSDLLKVLEAVESSDLQRVPSPPHQCTPEQIEKKRLEAKLKLEKKKKAAAVAKSNRLPGRSSLGSVRR